MITLLSECHFWTTHDDVRIKPTDFGAFKYCTKRDPDVRAIVAQGKREYAEKRDGTVIVSNRRPSRLKESLKRFEELLKVAKVVRCEWREANVAQLMFSNGILVHVCVNVSTGDVEKMAFDKYFVGKLASETVTDAVFTRQHIVLSYNINQITVVFLQKPNMRRSGPEKISNMDPKIFHVVIPGPAERKLPRNLLVNNSFDLIVVWTKSSLNEVYPWRPTIRDQDRANVHVFKLRSAKLESVAFCWTENDPICMEFIRASEGQVMTVEQKISRKGEITAEICSYEIAPAKMIRIAVTSIPVGTQICCHGFSPDQEKLVLGTIDRYICVHDLVQKVTKFAPKTDIIPTHCTWHPDSGVFMISNDRCQFQCLDLSLSFVANQMISEDVTPSNLHDLSHYFAIQPTLLKTSFSCKADLNNFNDSYAQTDCFLLMVFENGPIGCMRFLSGTGMSGDVHNSGLTPDVLVNKYLAISQMERAVNVLMSLNWDTYGAMCLIALHKIAIFVFTRNDAKRSRNELLRRALQSFTDELSEETKDEFGDQVIDLKRRYFFFLLRHRLYNEAYEMARNIEDYDLFMDLYNITKSDEKLHAFAAEAFRQANAVLNQNDSTIATSNITPGDTNSISSCSYSSCSECIQPNQHKKSNRNPNSNTSTLKSTATSSGTTQALIVKRFQKNRQSIQMEHESHSHSNSNMKSYVPPLPYYKSKVFNAENIKINIPKPELRAGPVAGLVGTADNVQGNYLKAQQYTKTSAPPPLPDAKKRGRHYPSGGGNDMQPAPLSQLFADSTLKNINNSNFRNSIAYPDHALYNYPNGGGGESYNVPDRGTSFTQPQQHPNGLWSNVPDQTLGIPLTTASSSSSPFYTSKSASQTPSLLSASSFGMLPRASTNFSNSFHNLSNNLHQYPQTINSNNNNNNNSLQLMKSESLHNLPKFYQHPLVSGTIPAALPVFTPLTQSTDDLAFRSPRKPAVSILSNSSSTTSSCAVNANIAGGVNNNIPALPPKKDSGEKNKVKFSDTVQVAVVPEIPRKEKSLPTKRNGFHPLMTDPKKELADSLPLCHPNDDYLKDFNPATTETTVNSTENAISDSEQNNGRSAPTIKVVHFGVV